MESNFQDRPPKIRTVATWMTEDETIYRDHPCFWKRSAGADFRERVANRGWRRRRKAAVEAQRGEVEPR